jgi:hypothetical protein
MAMTLSDDQSSILKNLGFTYEQMGTIEQKGNQRFVDYMLSPTSDGKLYLRVSNERFEFKGEDLYTLLDAAPELPRGIRGQTYSGENLRTLER